MDQTNEKEDAMEKNSRIERLETSQQSATTAIVAEDTTRADSATPVNRPCACCECALARAKEAAMRSKR